MNFRLPVRASFSIVLYCSNMFADSQVKSASMAHVGAFASSEAAPDATETAEAVESSQPPSTDPTGATSSLTNGHAESAPESGVPANADVTDSAANAAGEAQWDNTMSASITQEDWVKVPRNPAETETGLTATPAASSNVQSWADDQPDNPPSVSHLPCLFPCAHELTSYVGRSCG
jgi:hypothetical protein